MMPAEKPATPPLLDLQNVSYHQQQTEILTDINWQLAAGQRWAVLGPNGSGKTTLVRVASGFQWHSGGTLRRLGEELIDLSPLRAQIGWVAADLLTRVAPTEQAIETVVSGRRGQIGLRRIGGVEWPTDGDFADAAALLESMGLSSLAEKPIRVLSQGERQQVLVARARMNDAVLLVLDEPCAGMDPGTRERFLAWLGPQMAQPTTPAVVMITHHVEEVLPEFDQTLLMAAGRIVAAGPTDEVLTPASLAATYGIPIARLEEHAGRRWPIWGGESSATRD